MKAGKQIPYRIKGPGQGKIAHIAGFMPLPFLFKIMVPFLGKTSRHSAG
ncbi:MAG TPA: hypothetical protein PLP19_03860 [bacterium]|nr:hypothetical protein [bacterium]HPN42603.1 hypothetical protein [bacterium]